MPTLDEVLDMFCEFGFSAAEVRGTMGAGDSAFNAFEGLKARLTVRWADLCQEVGVDRQRELRPVYDRLMGITMKSRITPAERKRQARKKEAHAFDAFMGRMQDTKERRQQEFFAPGALGAEKGQGKGDLDAAAEARARQTGIFGPDEEI